LGTHLPGESQPEIVKKAAESSATIFRELSSDEAAAALQGVVPALLAALSASDPQGAGGQNIDRADTTERTNARVALAAAVGAAAGTALDHFQAYATAAVAVLLPILRAGPYSQTPGAYAVSPALFAACLETAGSVVASAWDDPGMSTARDELAAIAQLALATAGDNVSEARAMPTTFLLA